MNSLLIFVKPMCRFFLIVIVVMCTEFLVGQGLPQVVTQDSSLQDSLPLIPDSVSIRFFNINNTEKYHIYTDSALTVNTHNYDPARLSTVDYIHLGNQGSAAVALQFDINPQIGFSEGHKQYDLYRYTLSEFKYYEGNTPLVNATFSPMGSQDHFVVTADFTRSFSDGFTVSSNYRRVNQKGIYNNQATKVTNLGVSIRYEHPNKRYTSFISMISNVAEEQNNGGPSDITSLTDQGIGNREVVPVFLNEAQTRHQQKEYSLINYFKINNLQSKYDFTIRYDLGYEASYYKYSDQDITSSFDSLFYQNFAIDFRGLRYYTRIKKLKNAAYLFLTNEKKLNIRLGLVYDKYAIDQDIVPSSYHNIYLDMEGNIPLNKNLSFITEGQIGIGDGVGDFKIDGAIDMNIGQLGSLIGGAKLYRHSPSLLERSFYLTQLPIWSESESLKKPVGSSFYGQIEIPYLKFKAKLSQHLIDNVIYFNEEVQPIQEQELYSATVVTIQNSLSWRIFNMHNTFSLQYFNRNVYGLPTYWSKHNVYLEFYMFKKNMLTRWGIETRLTTDYQGVAYSPVVGTFHRSGQESDFYPMTDVYLSGKVEKFKYFVKLENAYQLLDKNRVDTRVHNYPQNDWAIRFGISWLFLG